jgi:hypothetical protein
MPNRCTQTYASARVDVRARHNTRFCKPLIYHAISITYGLRRRMLFPRNPETDLDGEADGFTVFTPLLIHIVQKYLDDPGRHLLRRCPHKPGGNFNMSCADH